LGALLGRSPNIVVVPQMLGVDVPEKASGQKPAIQ
jgi:hypothetical protein